MKRKGYLAISIVLALALTACGASAKAKEHYDLGVKYISAGNYQEAILELTQAIEIDPKQVDAYLTLANIYIQQNNTDAAVAVIEQGLAALGSDESLSNKLEELTTTTTTTDQEQSAETSSAERTPESFAEREKTFEELDAYLQGVIQQTVTAIINNDEQALVALCNDETFGSSEIIRIYTRIDNYKVYFWHLDNHLSVDVREENGAAYMADVSGRIGDEAPYTYTVSRAEGHTQSWIWNGPFTMRYVWYSPANEFTHGVPTIEERNLDGTAINGFVDGICSLTETRTEYKFESESTGQFVFENCILQSAYKSEQWHNWITGTETPYGSEEDNQYYEDRRGQRAYLHCMYMDPRGYWFQWVDADYISPYDMENIDWN